MFTSHLAKELSRSLREDGHRWRVHPISSNIIIHDSGVELWIGSGKNLVEVYPNGFLNDSGTAIWKGRWATWNQKLVWSAYSRWLGHARSPMLDESVIAKLRGCKPKAAAAVASGPGREVAA